MNTATRKLSTTQEYVLQHYHRQTLGQMAKKLGKSYGAVQGVWLRLVDAGLANPSERAYQPPWTPETERWLIDHVGKEGWSLAKVAEVLDRPESGVRLKLKRLGIRRPLSRHTDQTLRLRDLMRFVGAGTNHDYVRAWILSGQLKAHRVPCRNRVIYAVYPVDLSEFLQQHPEAYDYDRIPATVDGAPNPYLACARRVAPVTAGYVCLKQAATALDVPVERMRIWARRGWIPAVHLQAAGIHEQEWFLTPAQVDELRGRIRRTGKSRWLLPTPAELADWRDRLDQAEKQLPAVPYLPTGPQRRRRLAEISRLIAPPRGVPQGRKPRS